MLEPICVGMVFVMDNKAYLKDLYEHTSVMKLDFVWEKGEKIKVTEENLEKIFIGESVKQIEDNLPSINFYLVPIFDLDVKSYTTDIEILVIKSYITRISRNKAFIERSEIDYNDTVSFI